LHIDLETKLDFLYLSNDISLQQVQQQYIHQMQLYGGAQTSPIGTANSGGYMYYNPYGYANYGFPASSPAYGGYAVPSRADDPTAAATAPGLVPNIIVERRQ
jgi:hypothetical protein